jgi:hypothetical protein
MTTPILLPPLPTALEINTPVGTLYAYQLGSLRAYSLEVARLVLEGAIGTCGHLAQADAVSHVIRALEVKHHE